MLNKQEQEALDTLARFTGQLREVIGGGRCASEDFREAVGHIHALQAMVMSNSAARAHPGRYRLLGGNFWAPTGPEPTTGERP